MTLLRNIFGELKDASCVSYDWEYSPLVDELCSGVCERVNVMKYLRVCLGKDVLAIGNRLNWKQMKGLVSKETVVPYRWRSKTRKFGATLWRVVSVAAFFFYVTQCSPKERERCVTSKKRLRSRLYLTNRSTNVRKGISVVISLW